MSAADRGGFRSAAAAVRGGCLAALCLLAAEAARGDGVALLPTGGDHALREERPAADDRLALAAAATTPGRFAWVERAEVGRLLGERGGPLHAIGGPGFGPLAGASVLVRPWLVAGEEPGPPVLRLQAIDPAAADVLAEARVPAGDGEDAGPTLAALLRDAERALARARRDDPVAVLFFANAGPFARLDGFEETIQAALYGRPPPGLRVLRFPAVAESMGEKQLALAGLAGGAEAFTGLFRWAVWGAYEELDAAGVPFPGVPVRVTATLWDGVHDPIEVAVEGPAGGRDRLAEDLARGVFRAIRRGGDARPPLPPGAMAGRLRAQAAALSAANVGGESGVDAAFLARWRHGMRLLELAAFLDPADAEASAELLRMRHREDLSVAVGPGVGSPLGEEELGPEGLRVLRRAADWAAHAERHGLGGAFAGAWPSHPRVTDNRVPGGTVAAEVLGALAALAARPDLDLAAAGEASALLVPTLRRALDAGPVDRREAEAALQPLRRPEPALHARLLALLPAEHEAGPGPLARTRPAADPPAREAPVREGPAGLPRLTPAPGGVDLGRRWSGEVVALAAHGDAWLAAFAGVDLGRNRPAPTAALFWCTGSPGETDPFRRIDATLGSGDVRALAARGPEVWLASTDRGVLRFRFPDGDWTRWRPEHGLPGPATEAVAVDSAGAAFATTGAGVPPALAALAPGGQAWDARPVGALAADPGGTPTPAALAAGGRSVLVVGDRHGVDPFFVRLDRVTGRWEGLLPGLLAHLADNGIDVGDAAFGRARFRPRGLVALPEAAGGGFVAAHALGLTRLDAAGRCVATAAFGPGRTMHGRLSPGGLLASSDGARVWLVNRFGGGGNPAHADSVGTPCLVEWAPDAAGPPRFFDVSASFEKPLAVAENGAGAFLLVGGRPAGAEDLVRYALPLAADGR